MTQQLTLVTRATTAGVVMELTGELDHHTAPDVRDALTGVRLAPGRQLTLDLAGVTFCDSSGLTVLIASRNHALTAGATLVLAAVPERVSRIIRVVGLEPVFPTHPTAGAAEDSWRPTTG
ncbi:MULTISPECIES: STAS domain-containing protein [unclassified Streptomyces]|uniref:STAS domain-containing protein n=1 Tax=unclassified Streptomyces TaxID=2593676 RepID=UPI0001B57997|nr:MULTISPECIES: STAS domain-containing protein [unclassified Streptomyces]MYR28385.1 anti-sigma factor antagonist [Streptomyces sp. SID4945]SCF37086.1 anti-anti-sigma factor [Streptomyces sp. LcepLS]